MADDEQPKKKRKLSAKGEAAKKLAAESRAVKKAEKEAAQETAKKSKQPTKPVIRDNALPVDTRRSLHAHMAPRLTVVPKNEDSDPRLLLYRERVDSRKTEGDIHPSDPDFTGNIPKLTPEETEKTYQSNYGTRSERFPHFRRQNGVAIVTPVKSEPDKRHVSFNKAAGQPIDRRAARNHAPQELVFTGEKTPDSRSRDPFFKRVSGPPPAAIATDEGKGVEERSHGEFFKAGRDMDLDKPATRRVDAKPVATPIDFGLALAPEPHEYGKYLRPVNVPHQENTVPPAILPTVTKEQTRPRPVPQPAKQGWTAAYANRSGAQLGTQSRKMYHAGGQSTAAQPAPAVNAGGAMATPSAQSQQPVTINIANQRQRVFVPSMTLFGIGVTLIAVNFVLQVNPDNLKAAFLKERTAASEHNLAGILPPNVGLTIVGELVFMFILAEIGGLNQTTNTAVLGLLMLFWLLWIVKNYANVFGSGSVIGSVYRSLFNIKPAPVSETAIAHK